MKGITITTNTPEEIAEEMKLNFGDKNNARLIILGTKSDGGGYKMRFGCVNPASVVGVLIHQALNTGQVKEALAMCNELINIGTCAKRMIEEELKRKVDNN